MGPTQGTELRGGRAAEFPNVSSSVPAARHLVRDDLVARRLPQPIIDDCLLVVSELMTNAVRHAEPLPNTVRGRAVRLHWTARLGQVCIGVTDGGGRDRPHVETASVADLGGRGLAIVEALTKKWGVTRSGTEVTVYAVMAA